MRRPQEFGGINHKGVKMGHFYFVRHGQTVWNVENKICGATDIALTELGHRQEIETGYKILNMGIEPRLIEQNFGKYEATTETVRSSMKQRSTVPVDMKAGSLCCNLHREFTIG